MTCDIMKKQTLFRPGKYHRMHIGIGIGQHLGNKSKFQKRHVIHHICLQNEPISKLMCFINTRCFSVEDNMLLICFSCCILGYIGEME